MQRHFVATPVVHDKGVHIGRAGFFHGFGDAILKGGAKLGDEVHALVGDADHDLAAVIGGMHALHVAELFQAINETGGGSGGVAHLAGDISHGQLLGGAEVTEKVKLGERHVAAAQVLGEVQQKLALTEQDKVGDFSRISLSASAFGSGCGWHKCFQLKVWGG